MVQELVKKSFHSSPEASFDTETGETDASAIARVQSQQQHFVTSRGCSTGAAHRSARIDPDLFAAVASEALLKIAANFVRKKLSNSAGCRRAPAAQRWPKPQQMNY